MSMSKNSKRKKISNILLIIAALLLVAGIGFLVSDLIEKNKRQEKIDEGAAAIESVIQAQETNAEEDETEDEPEMTMIVSNEDLQVDGEEYDYFGTEEEIRAQREAVQEELDSYDTGYTVLQGIGILEIPSIDLRLPIWEETNSVSLRYGAGHYVASVRPGQVGNCSILGHHMRAYGSIFNRLEEVEPGDEVIITNLRGYTFTYIIDETLVIDPDELGDYIRGGITDERQVTLVTCTYTSQGKLRFLAIGHIQDEE